MPNIIYKAGVRKSRSYRYGFRGVIGVALTTTSAGPARQLPTVLCHHIVDLVFTEPVSSEVQRKVAWLSQPFRMWPVRTKQNVLCADEVLQLTQIVFVERCNPDVLAELLDRI